MEHITICWTLKKLAQWYEWGSNEVNRKTHTESCCLILSADLGRSGFYIAFITLYRTGTWVTFQGFSLQHFNYVFEKYDQDLRDQQSPSLQKTSHWSNICIDTDPWTNTFIHSCDNATQMENNTLCITNYPFAILLF